MSVAPTIAGACSTPPPPLALALYSFVAALGFARVFGDWEFVGDVLIVVIVGHGLSWLLRQRPVPGAVAVAVTAIALGWVILWLNYPDHVRLGVPDRRRRGPSPGPTSALVRDQFADRRVPRRLRRRVVAAGGDRNGDRRPARRHLRLPRPRPRRGAGARRACCSSSSPPSARAGTGSR